MAKPPSRKDSPAPVKPPSRGELSKTMMAMSNLAKKPPAKKGK